VAKKKTNEIKVVVRRNDPLQKDLAARIDRLALYPGESCQSVGIKALANGIAETEAGIEAIQRKGAQ
jgi:hypothetical protein